MQLPAESTEDLPPVSSLDIPVLLARVLDPSDTDLPGYDTDEDVYSFYGIGDCDSDTDVMELESSSSSSSCVSEVNELAPVVTNSELPPSLEDSEPLQLTESSDSEPIEDSDSEPPQLTESSDSESSDSDASDLEQAICK
jgi:hypothetical protein